MPLGPNALAWMDALVRALVAGGHGDAAGVALQLSTTVTAYAAMAQSIDPEPPPPWWGEAVAEPYPCLAAAFAERGLSDPMADLDAAVARILA